MRPLRRILPMLLLLISAWGCTSRDSGGGVIICENSSWRVTTDSYSDNNLKLHFEADSATRDYPVLSSATPVLDRIYAAGVDDFFSDTPLFARPSAIDPAILALLDPDIVYDAVVAAARRSLNTRRDWPLEADNLSWIPAARTLVKVTGDSSLIAAIVPDAVEIVNRELDIAFDNELGLYRGLHQEVPPEITGNDAFKILSLRVNIDRVAALRALGEIIGGEEGKRYNSLASRITAAINDRYWIPEKGRYGCALWGEYYPILLKSSDNLAQAMAITNGIATPDMARSIMKAMPLSDEGAPDYVPFLSGHRPVYSPATQVALFSTGASMINEQAMLLGFSSMTAAGLRQQSHDTSDRASMAAAMLGFIAGISFSPDGLDIDPFIPEVFRGGKMFSSLVYRGDTIDLHITGTGSKVARMEIDGKPAADHLIPDTLKGHHRIEVVMANNAPAPDQLNYPVLTSMPPRPVIDSIAGNTFIVEAPRSGYSFDMAVNGISCQLIDKGAFSLRPALSGSKVLTAMAVDRNGYTSVPALPRLVFDPADTMMIYRSSIPHELREAIVNRLNRAASRRRKNRHPVPTHLEMTSIINTSLQVKVRAEKEGEYFVDMSYWRPTVNECFLTDVVVNDSLSGTFVMYSPKGFSNPVTVKLRRGLNRMQLIYHPLPTGNLQSGVCLEYLRFLPKSITQ